RSMVQLAVAVASVGANVVLIPALGWRAVVLTALGSAAALAAAMVIMYLTSGRTGADAAASEVQEVVAV
ncbi:MAG TPA: hypothetical protein VIG28_08115, partial [Leifsonia sp.]